MPHRTLPVGYRRPRRGATLVFVALMLVALLGVCAIAVDLSRIYVGVNELQTAADAAALRGALSLQRAPGGNPTATVTTFLSSGNTVMGTAVTDVTVQGWHWDANVSLRKAVAWGATGATAGVNAVSVTVTHTAGLLFGRALSVVVPPPRRTAIAWVANVGLTCVRPWMFEVTKVFTRGGVTVAANATPTEAQIAELRNAGLTTRVNLMVAPPTVNNPSTGIYGASLAGKWVGVDLPSNKTFQSAMNTCNSAAVSYPVVLDNAASGTSQNSSVVGKAVNNIEFQNAQQPNICPQFDGLDDFCNVTIPVMLGYATSGSFADAGVTHSARLLTTFRLLCFKRPDKGKTITNCSAAPSGFGWDKVEVGTMYGYLDYA
ncbi:MAG: pilus assembly protein TadG-related protein, partial [Gemmatimonadota bacterium]|nr:pilus assembly protein TadG-related protein [Gemmatimonadota bacterium]